VDCGWVYISSFHISPQDKRGWKPDITETFLVTLTVLCVSNGLERHFERGKAMKGLGCSPSSLSSSGRGFRRGKGYRWCKRKKGDREGARGHRTRERD
jgi:hypothetical protein